MREIKEIRDDQIRIIGKEENKIPRYRYMLIVGLIILGVVIIAGIIYANSNRAYEISTIEEAEPVLFEKICVTDTARNKITWSNVDSTVAGYTEIRDTVINDIPLKLYIPHNAQMSLQVGAIDKNDTTIIYAAQAADVRADNGGIVGAFVLAGEPLAWGVSKKGYCASINGNVTIGVAENSPLFEEATKQKGYFFRQYPLVSNGRLIDNEPKGKSIRRAICEQESRVFMVETVTRESFHDFAQALVDLSIDNAIYLVGSSAYGWAIDANGTKHEFGKDDYYTGRRKMPKNISYLVWRKIPGIIEQ